MVLIMSLKRVLGLVPLLLLASGVLLSPGTVRGAEEPGPVVTSEAPQPQASFPGPGELVPRATELANQALETESKAKSLSRTDELDARFVQLQQQLQDLQRDASAAGPLGEWFASRLLDFKNLLEQHRGLVDRQLQQPLTERINQLTSLSQEWRDRKSYWQQWHQQLSADHQNIPEEVFRRANKIIDTTLAQLKEAVSPLLKVQEQVLAHQEGLLALQGQFDSALAGLKNRTFKRNSRGLFSQAFLEELRGVNWERETRSASALMGLDRGFVRQSAGLIVAQLVIAALVCGAILRYRRRLEATSEWTFICSHPLATGVFAAVPLSLFYVTSPPLWQLLQAVLGVFAATILVSSTVENPRRRVVVYLVAVIFTVSLVLKIIALPVAYYRLYQVALSLLGAPWLWWYGQRNLHDRQRMTIFTAYLRLGSTLLFVSLVAQVSGFTTLGSLLIEATIETVIVVLFVNMARKLLEGAVGYLLGQPLLNDRLFFQRHGSELAVRMKNLFKVFAFGYALVYLLTVWGVFDSLAEAFNTLFGFEVVISEFRFSVLMALLVVLVLYLTLLVSWLLRSLLDDQYFPRQDFDRGVRDAIKKLLHYSLVLIGFLLAASLAGIELKNFAVLAGAFGIGIGFGLQDIVNNFLSGLILLFERPVKVGDGVLIDGEYGVVIKIGMRSTVVETLDQAELIVPNSQMISQKVTNWTLSTRRVRLVIPVGVAYGSDVPLVMQILMQVGAGHEDVLQEPPPSPIFTEFGDSSLNFELRVWIANVDLRPRVKSELLQAIDRQFREHRVEIPFPQRDLHLRSVDGRLLGRLDRERSEE